MKVPVVIIIFNRYDNAKKVIDSVRNYAPEKIYIIADGHRPSKPDEAKQCLQARKIVDDIDWPCKIEKNFADQNFGCKKRVSSGLDWVFEKEEQAIILEDDCVPSNSFYFFCEELLEKYKDDERIMLISGDNKTLSKTQVEESYYFSRNVQIWGWATWRRAWKKNDINMSNFDTIKKNKYLKNFFPKQAYFYYWESLFDYNKKRNTNSWAVPWVYSVWTQSGLSIVPQKNLITNIGFSSDATHTTESSIFKDQKSYDLSFPLKHPDIVMPNYEMDCLEMKVRLKDEKKLPYPLNKWASMLKWFILDRIKHR